MTQFTEQPRQFPEGYDTVHAQRQFVDAIYARTVFDHLRWMRPHEVSNIVKNVLHKRGEKLALRINDGPIPTQLGDWTLLGIGDRTDGHIHEALVYGDIHQGAVEGSEPVPIYICQSNHFGETYYERENDQSKKRLHQAMDRMRAAGRGVVIYLHQEGKGKGIAGELERLNRKYSWENGVIVERDAQELTPEYEDDRHFDPEVVAHMLQEMNIDLQNIVYVDGSLGISDVYPGSGQDDETSRRFDPQVLDAAVQSFDYAWFEPFHAQDLIKSALQGQGHQLVQELGRAPLPTEYGDWTVIAMGDKTDGSVHHVLAYGDVQRSIRNGENILVRLHSACHTSETYHAVNCECREELQQTMQMIQQEGAGVIVYLQQEGRGNGVVGKLDQLKGMFGWNTNGQIEQKRDPDTGERVNTVQAYIEAGYVSERRDFTAAGQILQHLGLTSVRLVSNNPRKMQGVEAAGISVEPVSILIQPPNEIVASDLMHKAIGDGHRIPPEYWQVVTTEPVEEAFEGEAHDVQ